MVSLSNHERVEPLALSLSKGERGRFFESLEAHRPLSLPHVGAPATIGLELWLTSTCW
jgi:hypothetical protein